MDNSSAWRPSASIALLRRRAASLAAIRQFFQQRDVLEVETPSLCRYSVTDPHMPAIQAANPLTAEPQYFLQTSPEYAMKRLLASGSGAIFQIAKAFRQEERGTRHNPEFTLLEWYRPGFDHFSLMDEVEELVAGQLDIQQPFVRLSYRQVFEKFLSIDPYRCDCASLQALARELLDVQMESDDKDDWLNLLLAQVIEPKLAGQSAPGRALFIYDYPASQASLARIRHNDQDNDDQRTPVAQRFELYVDGIELANGFFELDDVDEQLKRFQQDQQQRARYEKPPIEIDQYLIAALKSGLPSCSGVALGVDRLLMLATGASSVAEVMAFDIDRA